MILISWNIDSLNAALTGTSARAEETRQVQIKFMTQILILLQFKKPSCVQRVQLRSTKQYLQKSFLNMITFGVLQKNRPEKVMQEQCIFIKKN